MSGRSRAAGRAMAKSIGVAPTTPTGAYGPAAGPHGGFSPLDLPAIVNWWTADSLLNTGLNDGDVVTRLNDLTGNSVPYLPGVGPNFKLNQQNGLPAMQFNGTTQWLRCQSIGYRGYPVTMFVVARNTVADDNAEHWIFGCQIGADTWINADHLSTDFFSVSANAGLVSTVATDTNWHIHVFQSATGVDLMTYRVDGRQVTGAGNGNNASVFGADIGARAGTGRFFGGFIGEGGVVGGGLSLTDMKRLERYLSLRWNIPVV